MEPEKNKKVLSFVCGETHMICLMENKKVFGWGTCSLLKDSEEKEVYELHLPKQINEVEIDHKFLLKGASSN